MTTYNPVRTLLGIFTIVWVLVLAIVVIIFRFIVPLVIFHSFLDSVIKGILATILVIVWIGLFVMMRNLMVRRHLATRKTQT